MDIRLKSIMKIDFERKSILKIKQLHYFNRFRTLENLANSFLVVTILITQDWPTFVVVSTTLKFLSTCKSFLGLATMSSDVSGTVSKQMSKIV
jgi:hypothetical protein